MPKKDKVTSTYARWMQKPAFRKAFDEGYQELLLSELVLAVMAEDKKSVRELASELGLSKTVIQNLRSGMQADMKLSNFLSSHRPTVTVWCLRRGIGASVCKGRRPISLWQKHRCRQFGTLAFFRVGSKCACTREPQKKLVCTQDTRTCIRIERFACATSG